jgi:hypothetical protein
MPHPISRRAIASLTPALLLPLILLQFALAQTPTPDPQAALIQEIKAQAARHVKINSPPQTQLIIDLYRNKSVGLTPLQISELYEEEYVRQKELQKPGPFEQLRPHLGWIVAALLALLLIFYKVIEKWVTTIFEAGGKLVYKKLAGNRRLRRFALRHYQRMVVRKYENIKIAFSERPLKMRDVYVPLRVRGRNSKDQVEAYRAIADNNRLMIVGSPGSGKSMLLKYFAFTYADRRMSELQNQPVPILFELHNLNEKPELSVEQHLIEEMERYEFPSADSFVKHNLQSGSIMLLLDGLDEVNSNERIAAVKKIRELLEQRKECRAIITCRNAVYNEEFADIVDQTLEVDEFSDQQIRRFLRPWGKYMPVGRSIEHLMQTLQDRPRIMALARNPLMLTIIAYLYTDTPIVLPHSRAEFYRQSTDFLLGKLHQEYNHYEARDKQVVLEHLAFYFQDSARQRQQDRRSVDYETVMNQVKLVLPKLNLNPEDDVRPLLKEIVQRSDLLRAIDNNERYQFAHLTLQEYFAAERLLDDAQGLFDRFVADPDTWRETVKLWCGLGTDSTWLIRQIYDKDPVTAFECLADAKQVDQEFAEEVIGRFKASFNTPDGKRETIIKAFGSVAADLRPRGKEVFNFLATTIDAGQGEEQKAAAAALSLTNLPVAAQKLIAHYDKFPEVSAALVRMGDLAVPSLKEMALSGNVAALHDLFTIGTPQAALALVPLLWGNNIDFAVEAAHRLGRLLSQPNIEDSLHEYNPTAKELNATSLKWVWEPFEVPPGSSLPIIAGRIAFFISNWPQEVSDASLPIDSRIIIPLLIDQMSNNNLPTRKIERMKAIFDFKRHLKTLDEQWPNQMVPVEEFYALIDMLTVVRGERLERLIRLIAQPKLKQLLVRWGSSDNSPTVDDWRNLSAPVSYRFSNSLHCRAILVIFTLALLTTLLSVILRFREMPSWVNWQGAGLAATVLALVLPTIFIFAFRDVEDIVIVLSPYYHVMEVLEELQWSDEDFWDRIGFTAFLIFGLVTLLVYQPLAIYFSASLMSRYLNIASIVSIWVAVPSLIFIFFRMGARKDRAARNPLWGILDNQEAGEASKQARLRIPI